MKSLVLVVLFAAVVTASSIQKPPITTVKDLRGEDLGSRIISGEVAAEGQFPWQAVNRILSGQSRSGFCGAALICDSWLLTAAHCAMDIVHFTIYLGSVNQSQAVEVGRIELETTESIIHERYNQFNLNNDIALIKLQEKVNFTDKIQPIPLGSDAVEAGVTLTVSGWGKTRDGIFVQPSPVLNYVNVTTISNEECEDVYGDITIKNTTLCCRGRPEHSTCQGDSGGPLVQQLPDGSFVHVGVVSFVSNYGCASGHPSGYIRTAMFRDWIKEKINGTCQLP